MSFVATSDYYNAAGKRCLIFYVKTKKRFSFSVQTSALSLASVEGSILPGSYSLASKSGTPLHSILLAVLNARSSGSMNYRISPDLDVLISS